MQSLNSSHLEYLSSALRLLENGLKQNALTLTPTAPVSAVVLDVLDSEYAEIVSSVQSKVNLRPDDTTAEDLILATKIETVDEIPGEFRQSCKSYFQKLAWNARVPDISAIEPVAVEPNKTVALSPLASETSKPKQASLNYFNALPWQTAVTNNKIIESSQIGYKQDSVAAGGNYFRSLPWLVAADKTTAGNEKLTAEFGLVKHSGSYFKEIFWKGSSASAFQEISLDTTKNLQIAEEQDLSLLISADYFKDIPWRGALSVSDKQQQKQVKSDVDRSWMVELATKNALATAARNIKENRQDQQNCQAFFQRVFLLESGQNRASSQLFQSEKLSSEASMIPINDKQKILTGQNQHYFQKLPWN